MALTIRKNTTDDTRITEKGSVFPEGKNYQSTDGGNVFSKTIPNKVYCKLSNARFSNLILKTNLNTVGTTFSQTESHTKPYSFYVHRLNLYIVLKKQLASLYLIGYGHT